MDVGLNLRSLEEEGDLSQEHETLKKALSVSFEKEYQSWYSQAHAVVRQLLPHRLDEFETLYLGEKRRKEVDSLTYTIQDWLLGVRSAKDYLGKKHFNDAVIAIMRFKTQLEILRAVEARFESSLFDIKQLVQADLFDSELDSARELLKNGFLRPAGAVAGVVLEKHLCEVCAKHKISTRKKNPTINDFNELLKSDSVIDVPDWRFVQRLGDLRNLCDHNKERDPTDVEVRELIDGVDKITKTMF